MKTIKLLAILFITSLFLTSCGGNDDDDDDTEAPLGAYEHGFFILNEGNFSDGNASVTFVSDDYSNIEKEVFKGVNGGSLGDVAQSIYTYEDKMYIIVNNSDKIEVVNRYTMKSIKTIETSEVNNPRYMVEYDGIGYVTNWGDGAVTTDDTILVIDLENDTVTETISVGEGPENIVVVGDKLYVAMKGAWGVNNKILVIDTVTKQIISEIEVGDVPNSMTVINDELFVLSGNKWLTLRSSISVINLNTNTVKQTYPFIDGIFPNYLTNFENDIFYSLNNDVYSFNSSSLTLPTEPETGIDASNNHGLFIKEGLIYVTVVPDYVSEGSVKIYNLSNNSLVQDVSAGIAPNGVAF